MRNGVFLALYVIVFLTISYKVIYAYPDSFPQYCCNSTNSTIAGKPTLFSLKWEDDAGLSGYIFSLCNGTWNGTHCLLENWLEGWQYRKSHTINNSTGAGTNYPIKIVVNNVAGTDGGDTVYIYNKARSDFGDIRFTDDDGVTLLNYWVESKYDGINATFWVEVNDDLSSNPAKIYVYYGNPSATSLSNGDSVFEFFDDFSGFAINSTKWDVTESSWNPSQGTCTRSYELVNGELKITSTSTDVTQDLNCPGQCGYSFRTKNSISTQNFTVYAKARFSNGNDWTRGFGSLVSCILIDNNTDKWGISLSYDGDDRADIYQYLNGVFGSTNVLEYGSDNLIFNYTKLGDSIFLSMNGAYYSRVVSSTEPLELPFNFSFVSDAGGCWWGSDATISWSSYYDFVIIRKYTSPEPTHGIWGAEELATAWLNDTWVPFFENPKEVWSNVTKVINSTVESKIAWQVYANDTNNNWNVSEIYSFITSSEIYCGNGVCDSGETCSNCPSDCKCPGSPGCCGNSCGCPSGQVCENNVCKTPYIPAPPPSIPKCPQDFVALDEEKNVTLVVKCIDRNQTRNFTFSKFLVSNLTLTANSSIYTFIIRIEKIPEMLIDENLRLDKKVYNYLDFSKENLDENFLKKIIVRFKVEKIWIFNENINISTISLYRLVFSWERLNTHKIDEDPSYVYFESELPSFSLFAIAGEVALPPPECPACPQPSEWGECVQGKRNRTVYTCGEETNFSCLEYVQEEECEEEKKEEKGLPILYLILPVIACPAIIVFLIFYLKRKAKAKEFILTEEGIICPRCGTKMEKSYSGEKIEIYKCAKCGYLRSEVKRTDNLIK